MSSKKNARNKATRLKKAERLMEKIFLAPTHEAAIIMFDEALQSARANGAFEAQSANPRGYAIAF